MDTFFSQCLFILFGLLSSFFLDFCVAICICNEFAAQRSFGLGPGGGYVRTVGKGSSPWTKEEDAFYRSVLIFDLKVGRYIYTQHISCFFLAYK